jgi:hypothetical protein
MAYRRLAIWAVLAIAAGLTALTPTVSRAATYFWAVSGTYYESSGGESVNYIKTQFDYGSWQYGGANQYFIPFQGYEYITARANGSSNMAGFIWWFLADPTRYFCTGVPQIQLVSYTAASGFVTSTNFNYWTTCTSDTMAYPNGLNVIGAACSDSSSCGSFYISSNPHQVILSPIPGSFASKYVGN